MNPVVAIVGRPNVGKSTLFNRLIGSREAIALHEAGVTRDRHYGYVSWAGREFVVIDTGGFPGESRRGLEAKVYQQIELAVSEAQTILFVLDARSGLVPLDREIDRQLRASGRPILRVVNKIDPHHQGIDDDEIRLSEFQELGEVQAASAEHGYRIGDLLDALVATLTDVSNHVQRIVERGGITSDSLRTSPPEINVAIIGRPNVGKSSLLNRLLGEERAIVHESPGTTRDVIDTVIEKDGQTFRLLDTAGIRRKGKWESNVERVAVLKTIRGVERCDICLLVLDAGEGIQKQDAHVASYADEAGKGIIVVWNKWDLVEPRRGIESVYQQKVRGQLPFLQAPVLTVSAKTGWRIERIWDTVPRLYKICGRKVPTRQLNEALEEAVLGHNRPVYKGKEVRFLYATQVGTFPPRFLVFVSEPDGVHVSYQRYLANRIRKAFDLDGAPIRLSFRKKT